jgi:hypothetical protein
MFGFRPDLTQRDVNVEGQDNTPGFRVTDPEFGTIDPAPSTPYPAFGATDSGSGVPDIGFRVTDPGSGAADIGFRVADPGFGDPDIGFRITDPGVRPAEEAPRTYSDGPYRASQSIVPVKWGTESTSDNHPTPSIWDDAQNAMKWVGRGADAVVNGAYSIFPGTGNFLRESGRGLGFYGPEEAHRFGQEASVIGQGLGYIAHHPCQTVKNAANGTIDAVEAQPLLPFYAVGRLGMGTLLMLNGIPIAPLAALGDGWREVENGHNVIDAIGRAFAGPGPGGR